MPDDSEAFVTEAVVDFMNTQHAQQAARYCDSRCVTGDVDYAMVPAGHVNKAKLRQAFRRLRGRSQRGAQEGGH